ncbi:MAG: acyl-CoA dehydrogenase family protein [Ignavibacteria bacterium]|jgi:alkylation response protein AidB-like acyl-CoA dehydrogenase|nr:acyl-CoA dehydrogenase family protein [Ignavibacteria bacterium]MDH7527556.1 acyl-CoA dehydrogenase family protein [Ignavibacteria bacterium]
MFGYRLDEQLMLIQQSIREFSEKEILPNIMKWDEDQIFPRDVFTKLGEQGFMGILVPEEFGGAGLGYTHYALVVEELARYDPSISLSVAAHNGLCTNHINLFGTKEQKEKYLVNLAQGKFIGAWCLTEPTSGSDAGSLKSIARKENGQYIINGSKTFATHGSVGEVAVVFAKTNPEKGKKGISAFIVETNSPGYIVLKKENKLGCRASDTTQLSFDNLTVPEENLLGREDEGFMNALQVLQGGRISIAAMALGLAEGAYEAALKYSKERQQFGKSISEFQAIQFKLADMKTMIEAARLLVYRAAALKDQGKDVSYEASLAKLYASEIAVKITEQALQIHGGYGFTKDFPVEKFYRDVKLTTIGEGTSEIQRLIIAKSILSEL